MEEQAVDVICICDVGGEIRPLRLRTEQDNREKLRIDIDEVISTRQIHYVGSEANIYLCRARVHDRERLFELKYLIRSHTWKLMQSLW